jgi:hypothetical protein
MGHPPNNYFRLFGIVERDSNKESPSKRLIQCPNCNEPQNDHNKFCYSCKLALSITSYQEIRNEDKQKVDRLENSL